MRKAGEALAAAEDGAGSDTDRSDLDDLSDDAQVITRPCAARLASPVLSCLPCSGHRAALQAPGSQPCRSPAARQVQPC